MTPGQQEWPAPLTALLLRLSAWLLARHTKAGRWQPVQGEHSFIAATAERSEKRLIRMARGEWPSTHLTAPDGQCRTKGHIHA